MTLDVTLDKNGELVIVFPAVNVAAYDVIERINVMTALVKVIGA